MLIRDVEVGAGGDGSRADVRLRGDIIDAVGLGLSAEPGEEVVDGGAAALLPGLHDHHIHLLSLAAAMRSVRCGPPRVRSADALSRGLREAAANSQTPDDWIRGTGYHASVAGDLDAAGLEALLPGRAVRIQHRSGAEWVVSRTGLSRLGLSGRVPEAVPEGVERDDAGHATGRLYRVDAWLRERLSDPMAVSPPDLAPDLAPVGAALARCGVTGVTDATATNDASALALLSGAVAGGALPQRLVVMGDPSLPEPQTPGVTRGAVKLVLAEAAGLDFGHVVDAISGAHAGGRPLAVHCVTRAELVLALGAFDAAGVAPGDRIEHASIAPPDLAAHLAELGLAVVTQPHFVAERGDAYLQEVGPDDLPWLYRCQGLVSAGVALGAGTDAPFGDPDPWRAMQAAVERRTAGGASLGRCEALSPERALALFTTPAGSPGGPPREITPGAPADLCLLDRPWARARDQLDASCVIATITGGKTTWRRSP